LKIPVMNKKYWSIIVVMPFMKVVGKNVSKCKAFVPFVK